MLCFRNLSLSCVDSTSMRSILVGAMEIDVEVGGGVDIDLRGVGSLWSGD